MATSPFRPGFHISVVDTIALVVGGIVAVLASQAEWWMGLIIGFVVGHFFLFCNVFRIARPLELAWTAIFVALAGGTIATEMPGWQVTLTTSLIITLLVILLQLRKPSYHGVAWRWINPDLPQWWAAQRGGPGRDWR